jgi:SET family sugar efflux transporter-like MFS transporter
VVRAGTLGAVTTLPLATVALIVIGGPAGVGSSMLFAHLRHSGSRPADIVNTRAIVSVAWIAGPPLATVIIGWLGNRAILVAIAAVAVLNIGTTAIMIRHRRAAATRAAAGGGPPTSATPADESPVGRLGIVLVTAAFVLLQAGNATAMTMMTIYVTQTLRLDVLWAGISLGVTAALEVPALVLIGRLTGRFASLGLIATGCVAGIAYYVALAFATGPVMLLALQPLNAWCFAAIAGVGLTLFQQMIARPGLATGLYMNTRRIGAIVSGPVIALGSLTVLGQRGIFLAAAALTVISLGIILVAGRTGARTESPATVASST